MLPSTLHLFWDLLGMLGAGRIAILLDASTYPIARWGVERAAARGTPVEQFAHHDVEALTRRARHWLREGRRPVIVADGYCPSCGKVTPVAAYAQIARQTGGQLVLDDTQALGVLGANPDAHDVLGCGGGGSLCWHGVRGPHILVGASLAKAFGAPVAVLSGSAEKVDWFRRRSETRIHCSPPSVAVLRAASRALAINREKGDAIRRRLVALVMRLRDCFARVGLIATGALPFPMQSFKAMCGRNVEALHDGFRASGVRMLLTKVCRSQELRLGAIVTAAHSKADIDFTARAAAQLDDAGHSVSGLCGEAIWIR
ncbi:aminotransferase class I/II-fold pyridoxal phosphate-dependent enzyme [Paraburkholderia sp. UCT31]|uniref:aminotransferase class I/II-fold pyridoxal phosphate-dependent enzyme n=1 Tax=Paraburkholderia sp. UCT31 TaxID=2615209 RepID=UPI001655C421|nr:aminotransferase class I/II-fold pyridoxal phosphate-dependent enzyme [Paraburkholderia sp. UCT31]